MVDRTIVYAGQQPTDTDWLKHERNMMVGLAAAAQASLGTNTVADGLQITPSIPANMIVNIAPGSIYQQVALDANAYGSLPVDTVHLIIKQGISLDSIPLTLTPPVVAGQAVNYLIQAQLQEVDDTTLILPYFDSANPLVPFTGPNGTGTAQPTRRACKVLVQAKVGVAATAGSQVTPAPDAGFIGLYSVTVANGATSITSGNIITMPNAPLISVKLPDLPRWTQGGSWLFAVDAGTANAMKITPTPYPTTPPRLLAVKKIATANTGAMTIQIVDIFGVVLGTYTVLHSDGTAIANAEMSTNFLALLVFDGTAYRFVNSNTSTSVGALTASSGEGINVNGSAVVALNFPSLTDVAGISAADVLAYYNQAQAHHRSITWAELLAAFTAALPGTVQNVALITTSGTWNKQPNTKKVLVWATGGGGGGGGDPSTIENYAGWGGAAGGTAFAFVDVSSTPSVVCSIGPGGAGVSGGDGLDGGTTSFGTFAVATGGKGGPNSTKVAANNLLIGPVGGVGTVGLMLMRGGPGQPPAAGGAPSAVGNIPGPGGDSFWGGGGQVVRNQGGIPATPSQDGTLGGGGAGGDKVSSPGFFIGANGGAGCILIIELA